MADPSRTARVLETDVSALHAQALRHACAWMVAEIEDAADRSDLREILAGQPMVLHILSNTLPVLGGAHWCDIVMECLARPVAAPVR